MRCAMILRIWDMGTRSPGVTAGVGREAGAETGAAGLGSAGRAGVPVPTAVFDEVEDVLLGDAGALAGAFDLGEIDVVLAGELADERGGADVFFFCGERGGLPRLYGSGGGGNSWSLRDGSGRRGFGGSGGCGSGAIADDTDYGVDLDGVALGDFDFLEDAAGGGGDFGVDLVGGDFEQRLVALDFVAGLFEPLGDGAFEDGLAHLGHDYVSRHGSFLPFDKQTL